MNEHQNQSIKDRLKNVARASGKDFNFVSIQYMQERFLARLEKSAFREHLILPFTYLVKNSKTLQKSNNNGWLL